jgi:hypothetical protein
VAASAAVAGWNEKLQVVSLPSVVDSVEEVMNAKIEAREMHYLKLLYFPPGRATACPAEVDCFRVVVGPVAIVETATFEVVKGHSKEAGLVSFDLSKCWLILREFAKSYLLWDRGVQLIPYQEKDAEFVHQLSE